MVSVALSRLKHGFDSRRERQGSDKSPSFLNNKQLQALHLPLVVSTGGVLDAFWDGAEQEPTRHV